MNKSEFAQLLREAIYSIQFKGWIENVPEVRQRMFEATGIGTSTLDKWSRKSRPAVPSSIEPHVLEKLAIYCLKNGRLDRRWGRSFLTAGGYRDGAYETIEAFLDTIFLEHGGVQPNVVLCYQWDQAADAELARKIISTISGYTVLFVEPPQTISDGWNQGLTDNLLNADYVIVLLSAAVVHGGEMIKTVLDKAERLSLESGHQPNYLPIRIGYRKPFVGQFARLFNNVNWASWEAGTDSGEILKSLQSALRGENLPIGLAEKEAFIDLNQEIEADEVPPIPRYVDGAIDSERDVYIEREVDKRVLEEVRRTGETIVIKGPSQVGKSSLLFRVKREAMKRGKKVVYLDFSTLTNKKEDQSIFFEHFFYALFDAVDIQEEFNRDSRLPLIRDFTSQVETQLLAMVSGGLVLMIDGADALFRTSYYEDFFRMLRSWHNNRATSTVWRKLDMVLVTSTEEYLHMLDQSGSPFNVGHVFDLPDFSQNQVEQLNMMYGSPFAPGEIKQLMDYLSGHPYLCRKAMFEVSSGNMSSASFFETIIDERGAFGDHLRSLVYRVSVYPELIDVLRRVLRGRRIEDRHFWMLKGVGLVEQRGWKAVMRRKLYAEFFGQYFK